jgi:hypothetical protein
VGIVVDILVGEDSIPVVVALLFGLGILHMRVMVAGEDCILVVEGDSIRLYPSRVAVRIDVRRDTSVFFCCFWLMDEGVLSIVNWGKNHRVVDGVTF